jgi:hypothetical protein
MISAKVTGWMAVCLSNEVGNAFPAAAFCNPLILSPVAESALVGFQPNLHSPSPNDNLILSARSQRRLTPR